jgi:parallel beta-helix repeat protein
MEKSPRGIPADFHLTSKMKKGVKNWKKYLIFFIFILMIFLSFKEINAVVITNCSNLTSANTLYTLNNDILNNQITGACINITAQNVTLDCQGYYISSIQNISGVFSNQFNSTIENCNISVGSGGNGNARGIYFYGSNYSTLLNNIVLGNPSAGILLYSYSNYNTLINNIGISSSGRGIYIYSYSNYNTLINNTGISNSSNGIYLLSRSSNNTLTNNTGISNSNYGIWVSVSSDNNTLTNNTGISNSSNGIYIFSSDYSNLINNVGVSNSSNGISLVSSLNNTLINNIGTSNSSSGIYLSSFSSSIMINNIGTSNSGSGIYLYSSSDNNSLTNNTGTSDSAEGINITSSRNNLLINNTGMSNNSNGINLRSANYSVLINNSGFGSTGIFLIYSWYSNLTSNNGTSNWGYGITGYQSMNNTWINNFGFGSTGIAISQTNYSTLIGNIGRSNTSGMGISASTSSYNLLINNTGTSDLGQGLYLVSSFSNYLYNQQAIGTYGIWMQNLNNSIFVDCINVSGTGSDIWSPAASPSNNNTFINCSYASEYMGTGSTLIRKWYYRAYANDTSGNNVIAQVNATNRTGGFEFSVNTNSSGWTNITTITDYYNNGGTRTYYSNFTLSAFNSSYPFSSIHTYNSSLGNNLNDYFTFDFNVNNCSNLSVPNLIYTLSNDVLNNQITTACMNITAQNVTLDCQGHSIFSIQNITGIYSNQYNTTVQNCNITMGSGAFSSGRGIYLMGSNYSTLLNNLASGPYAGLILSSCSNNTLKNNTGIVNSGLTTGGGIYIYLSVNNTLINNIGISNSSSGIILWTSNFTNLYNNTGTSNSSYGIYLYLNSNNNTLFNNTGTSNSSYGIYLYQSSNNILTNNIATSNSNNGIIIYSFSNNNRLINNTGTSNSSQGLVFSLSLNNSVYNQMAIGYLAGSTGIRVYASNNTLFQDCVNITGATDVYVDGPSYNATFLNCSYRSGTNETVIAGSTLVRKWYYQTYVNDTSGNNVFAQINATNRTGQFEFSINTNSSGWTNITNITDYVNNGGTRTYYSNYTLSVYNSSYPINPSTHTYNASLGNNLNDYFTFISPFVLLNFTFPTPDSGISTTNTSFNVNISISILFLNEVKFNWNSTNYTLYNDSLLLMYNFENNSVLGENSTYFVDVSKYGNNGSCTGTSCPKLNTTAGKYGNAMTFDGVNDYINSSVPKPTLPLIIAFWVKPNIDNPVGIFDSAPSQPSVLRNYPAGNIEWWNQCPNISLGLSANYWTHIVVIFWHDGTNRRINWYKNGINQTGTSCVGSNLFNWTTLRLGDINTGSAGVFNGSLDNFMVFNRSLSADEISELYMSNIQKYNQTQWYLSVNQSMEPGTYNYSASAKDSAGNYNATEVRTITTSGISGCKNLTTANSIYTLANDILNNQMTSACINITAQNVTLDCQGHSIYSIQNYSGIWTNQNYATIKNCNVTTGNSGSNYAIYLQNSNYSTLFNNTGVAGCGIYLYYSSNNNLTANVGGVNGGGHGIILGTSSNNNTLINNTGTSNTNAGFYISSSYNLFINNSAITTSGSAIYITSSANNNTFTNTIATTNAGLSAIFISGSNNTLFKDCINISGPKNVYLMSSSFNSVFLNCSYNSSKETVEAGGGTIIKQWYYRAYTNDTNGNPIVAQINATNRTGNLEFSIDTNSSGWTNITPITDYVNNGTRYYYSNYTLIALNSSYPSTQNHIYNSSLGNNLSDYFTFNFNVNNCSILSSPNILYPLMNNISSAGNCMNITAQNVTFDCQGHSINYSISGTNAYGIYSNQNFTTIKNCTVLEANSSEDWAKQGIYFKGANNGTIYYNTLRSTGVNTENIYLSSSNNFNISTNNIINGPDGIHLTLGSNFSIITNNVVNSSSLSIYVFQGINSNITNNNVTSASTGISLYTTRYSNISKNNVNSVGNGIVLTSGSNYSTVSDNNVSSSGSHGIYIESSHFETVKNNNATSLNGNGIYLYTSSNNILSNNTGNGSNVGIYLYSSSHNNTLINNSGISQTGQGIYLWSSSNNTLTYCFGKTNVQVGITISNSVNNRLINSIGVSLFSYGIYLLGSNSTLIGNMGISNASFGIRILSNNNTFVNNIGISNYTSGVYLSSSSNNYFYNQQAIGYFNNGTGIYIIDSNNSLFQDCMNISGANADLNITGISLNNTFMNCSYNILKEFVNNTAQLTRKWYYMAYANDTSGNNVSATINATNNTGSLEFSINTSSSGWTNTTSITDYVSNGTRYYYSNYTITALNSSYPTSLLNHSYNATLGNNLSDLFTFCVPFSCLSLGYECGSWSDGCGGTLSCGSCSGTCNSGICSTAGGGGGGGEEVSSLNITLVPTSINVNIIVNTNLNETIQITNNGATNKTLSISQNNLDNMIILGNRSITLAPKETKSLNFILVAPGSIGIFTGKIIIGTIEVPVTLNVKEKFLLFDAAVSILNRNYKVSSGGELKTKIRLIPMGDEERMDVQLNYFIKDADGKVYLTQTETVLIENEMTLNRNFKIGDLPLGKYILGVELVYSGGKAPASADFEVVAQTPQDFLSFFMFTLIVAMIIVSIVIVALTIRIKMKKREEE